METKTTKILAVVNRNIDTLKNLVEQVKLQLMLIDSFYENDLIQNEITGYNTMQIL